MNDLAEALASNASTEEFLPLLHDLRSRGISRVEVLSVLQRLRNSGNSEITEDRILEAMDLVAGFCRSEDVVWDDHPKLD